MRRVTAIMAVASVAMAGCAASRSSGTTPGRRVDPAATPTPGVPGTDRGAATAAAAGGVAGRAAASWRHPAGHQRLHRAVVRYLRHRPGNAALMIRDRRTGASYGYRQKARFPAASVIKVNLLAGLSLLRQEQRRRLTRPERAAASRMIRASDNAAADMIYRKVGGARGIARLNHRLGLRCTEPNRRAWGSSWTCAEDQVRLLEVLAARDGPLSAAHRRRIWRLMASVVPGQRWGIGATARPGEAVRLKNGWTPLRYQGTGWAVHSIGRITGGPYDLVVAVFTTGSPGQGAGIRTSEHLSRLAVSAFRRGHAG